MSRDLNSPKILLRIPDEVLHIFGDLSTSNFLNSGTLSLPGVSAAWSLSFATTSPPSPSPPTSSLPLAGPTSSSRSLASRPPFFSCDKHRLATRTFAAMASAALDSPRTDKSLFALCGRVGIGAARRKGGGNTGAGAARRKGGGTMGMDAVEGGDDMNYRGRRKKGFIF